MTRLTVKVTKLQLQGYGNVSIRLAPTQTGSLPDFSAGSHIDVFLPNGMVRQYSIASAPSCLGYYELCVKKAHDSRGGSLFIHEMLATGDTLEISPPRNQFPLREGKRHILVAGGIGITPLISMMAELIERGQEYVMHYYTKTGAEVAYAQDLNGYIGQGLVKLYQSDFGESPRHCIPSDFDTPTPDANIYLCGPADFMSHMMEQALKRGWAKHQISQEAFGFSAKQVVSLDDGCFEVQLLSTGDVIVVNSGQSIAHALIEAGVSVPLSCEQGFCGACLTPVVTGVPEHRDSVMTDAEKILNDQIALCCSRSKSHRLVLKL